MVCLRSDDINQQQPAPGEPVSDYEFTGELDGGKVVDLNRPRRRPSATRVLAALVAVLTVLFVVAIVVRPQGPVYCAAGVQNLTPEQIKAINSGQVRNWNQLG